MDKLTDFDELAQTFGTQTFELKEEHIKLLRNAYVGWEDCEFGAPAIDCKRPYGNSSVYQDMLEIFGFKELKDGIYEFTLGSKKWLLKGEDKHNIHVDEEDLIEIFDNLHSETKTALQIILSTGKFETGTYERVTYHTKTWRKVK